jgi:hypothetical protein
MNTSDTSKVGTLATPQFSKLVERSLDQASRTNFQRMMYAISLAYTQPTAPENHLLDPIDLYQIGSVAGHSLLKVLDKKLKPESLKKCSEDDLQALFLLVVGTILTVGYTELDGSQYDSSGDANGGFRNQLSFSASQQNAKNASTSAQEYGFRAMKSHLCQILAHYVVYLGSRLNLRISNDLEQFILKAAPEKWHKQGRFWWTPDNTARRPENQGSCTSEVEELDHDDNETFLYPPGDSVNGYGSWNTDSHFSLDRGNTQIDVAYSSSQSFGQLRLETSSEEAFLDVPFASVDWPVTANQSLLIDNWDYSFSSMLQSPPAHSTNFVDRLATGYEPPKGRESSLGLGSGTELHPPLPIDSPSSKKRRRFRNSPRKLFQPLQRADESARPATSPEALAKLFRTTPKRYICNRNPCEESFSNIDDFINHLESCHPLEKRDSPPRWGSYYGCVFPVCHFYFESAIELRGHLEDHSKGIQLRYNMCSCSPPEHYINDPWYR